MTGHSGAQMLCSVNAIPSGRTALLSISTRCLSWTALGSHRANECALYEWLHIHPYYTQVHIFLQGGGPDGIGSVSSMSLPERTVLLQTPVQSSMPSITDIPSVHSASRELCSQTGLGLERRQWRRCPWNATRLQRGYSSSLQDIRKQETLRRL